MSDDPRSGPGTDRARRRAHPIAAQVRAEVRLTLSQGENLLVTVGIPVLLLVAFDLLDVLPTGSRRPVQFLVPSVLALALMSTGLVSLAIATGFERTYGVLKRLAATPLGRRGLLGAKIASVVTVEVIQVAVLAAVGVALGWHPTSGLLESIGACALATVAFGALGLLLAGTLPGEVVLGVANLLWLVLLLGGGILFPLTRLPPSLATVARTLPTAALASALHGALETGRGVPTEAWAVLGGWALAASLAAVRLFRWE